MLFRDFLAGDMLAKARGHAFQFSHRSAAHGGVFRPMLLGEGFDEIGPFQDDAAAGVPGTDFAEILEELGIG